jgi:uncharacterized membrane protein
VIILGAIIILVILIFVYIYYRNKGQYNIHVFICLSGLSDVFLPY